MMIPRLELIAVLIGARCVRFVKQQLSIQIDGKHLWTDSQCVLKWINSEKALSVFIRNRVKEIKGSPTWLIKPQKEWPGTAEEFTEKAEKDTRSELKKTVSLQPLDVLNVSDTSVTYCSGNSSPFGIKCVL